MSSSGSNPKKRGTLASGFTAGHTERVSVRSNAGKQNAGAEKINAARRNGSADQKLVGGEKMATAAHHFARYTPLFTTSASTTLKDTFQWLEIWRSDFSHVSLNRVDIQPIIRSSHDISPT